MSDTPDGGDDNSRTDAQGGAPPSRRFTAPVKWGVVVLSALAVAAAPVPEGVTPQSWRLLAIFVGTIVGSIVRPVPGGAMVLIGVTALVLTGTLTATQALSGYGDPVAWIALAAFILSRGMIKTGLGRRIAFHFIRLIGHRSLGLGYALVTTDLLLATVIPSNGARCGGIIFPIGKSMAEAYGSEPGPTANRLGAFLLPFIYQCDVIICAMFLTGQAGNLLIARFAAETAGVELSYGRWALAALAPGLVALAVVPPLLYKLFPPEVTHTPAAAALAREELRRLGPMARGEKLMLVVFAFVAALWATTALHEIHYSMVGLLGVCALLLGGVLEWEDVLAERTAWDVFVWYGGLLMMAGALSETGIIKRFAESSAGFTVGWAWWAALGVLLLIYFYSHYAFASISAHATAMYIPFLVVVIAAGAPAPLAALSLAFFSNLSASLTHYGTTPAPIFFGAGYVKQRRWWLIGLVASAPNILVWTTVGLVWWKLLGWW
jgi:DASS family divalent anion:Na+ symporter